MITNDMILLDCLVIGYNNYHEFSAQYIRIYAYVPAFGTRQQTRSKLALEDPWVVL